MVRGVPIVWETEEKYELNNTGEINGEKIIRHSRNILNCFSCLFCTGFNVSRITTGPRKAANRASIRIKRSKVDPTDEGIATVAKNEIDNHADTSVLGCNFLHIEDSGQVCSVSGFHNSFKELPDVPIVKAATAWSHPDTGRVFILIINQGLWMPSHRH